MVMANETLPAPATPGNNPPSPFGRTGEPLEFSRQHRLRTASSSSDTPETLLRHSLSECSLDERADVGEIVMPDPFSVEAKEDEARRRLFLSQELDERGICPVYDPSPSGSAQFGGREGAFDVSKISLHEMKGFLHSPSPKSAGMIECRIIRERIGINKLFPKYTLESDSGVFFMSAKKQSQNKTSNYAVSMSREELPGGKEGDSFMGKLRSNFLGLEFTAYGTGLNPKKIDQGMSQAHAIQLARQELLAVQYSSSLWGMKPRGPRKMAAVIPQVQPNGDRLVCRTLNPETEGLMSLQKSGNGGNLIDVYHNKPPKWNEQIGAFVLNFNKRVTQASVKNFQLTSSEDPDTVYLQFGRVGKDIFNMDFRYPISPFQAFAICLSSFDYKLCCE